VSGSKLCPVEGAEPTTVVFCEEDLSVKEYCEAVHSTAFNLIFLEIRAKSKYEWIGAHNFSSWKNVFTCPTLEEITIFLRENGQSDRTEMFRDRSTDAKSTTVDSSIASTWKLLVDLVRTSVIYGFLDGEESIRHRLLLTLSHWTRMLEYLKFNFIKLAKYKLAAFAAFAKGSDIFPPSPFSKEFELDNSVTKPELIFDSLWKRWFRSLPMYSQDHKLYQMSLIDSICRGIKKGADRPTEEMAHQSNLATFKLFTTPKDKPVLITEEKEISVNDMENEIIFTVDEIFKGFKEPVLTYGHFPSLSSCVENKFANGGSLLIVKENIKEYPREVKVVKKSGILLDAEIKCKLDPESLVRESAPKVDADGSFQKAIDYIEISTNYDNLGTDIDIEWLVAKALENGSEMKLIALLEALKIRGISNANAVESFLLKPIQKIVSRQLLKFACFKVTGTPLVEDHLENVIRSLDKDQTFVSGDYDNATNEMINSYTECCIRRICHHLNLSEDYTQLAVNSLCRNTILYSYYDEETKKMTKLRGEQKEAQPMGKVLSFVTLCIVNATVCRKALELDAQRFIALKDFPGLINGDDCCFPIKDPNHWVRCSAMVGLKNSIGKTFFSRNFIEMNSRTFVLDRSRSIPLPSGDIVLPRFNEVPFVNFGLVKGMVRSQQCDGDCNTVERLTSLGECHTEMVKGLDFSYDFLDALFREENAQVLEREEMVGIPYYIPKWLGGLGMSAGPRFFEKISFEQRCQASVIFQNFGQARPKKISSKKTCLLDSRIESLEEDLAKKLNVEFVEGEFKTLELQSGLRTDLEKENQLAYTALVEVMWRNMELVDLKTDLLLHWDPDTRVNNGVPYVRPGEEREYAQFTKLHTTMSFHDFQSSRKISSDFRRNGKLWRAAYGKIQQVPIQPLSWTKLWHEKQRGFLPIILSSAVRDQTEALALICAE
jgi:hypothetical protein